MTNVKQKSKVLKSETPFFYLTEQLAGTLSEIVEVLVARLNEKKLMPKRGHRYNFNGVINSFYGKYEDHNNQIELELIDMVAAHTGKTSQIAVHMNALRRVVNN